MAKPKASDVQEVPDWRRDATQDTGLIAILRASFGVVGNIGDLAIFVATFALGLIGVLWGACSGALASAGDTARLVQQWAALGANIAVAILGFLIAGFSVFATVTRPELFRYMARYKAKGRPISEFKFVFYNFLYIFAHYIIFLTGSVAVAFLFEPHSPIWWLAETFYADHNKIVDIAAAMTGVIIASYAAFSMLLLKSFLWNLYQTLVFAIFFKPPEGAED